MKQRKKQLDIAREWLKKYKAATLWQTASATASGETQPSELHRAEASSRRAFTLATKRMQFDRFISKAWHRGLGLGTMLFLIARPFPSLGIRTYVRRVKALRIPLPPKAALDFNLCMLNILCNRCVKSRFAISLHWQAATNQLGKCSGIEQARLG
jgi:hypothetical protein